MTAANKLYYMNGDSEMKTITRSFDWNNSILGPPENWPQSLHTTLSILLNSKFPMFLFWGPDSICFYNDAYRPSLGNKGKHPAVGKRGEECWPEIWPIIKPLIDRMLAGGEASWSEDQLIPIYRNGALEDVYWTFSYSPVFGETRAAEGAFVTCTETTEQVRSKFEEQRLNEKLIQSNKELLSSNQELTATNIELQTATKELKETQKRLTGISDAVKRSEETLRLAVDAARIGTWFIEPRSKGLHYNQMLADIFGYEDIANMTFEQAIGQVTENYRDQILKEIDKAIGDGGDYDITYSQRRFNDGEIVWLRSTGKVTRNSNGDLTFSGVVMDITKQIESGESVNKLLEELATSNEETQASNEELLSTVEELKIAQDNLQHSQQELEESEEALQFALQAAELGTFDLDPLTNRFRGNDRLKDWFGLNHDEEIELVRATSVIADKDRDTVIAAIQHAMTYGSEGHYDIKYTIVNPKNPTPRLVRAKGQALFNADKQPVRFSGTLQDITEEDKAYKELQRAYEQANLSKQAAQLGTFDLDLVENTMDWDARCRTLFGISHNNKVSYEGDFVPGLHEDDRDRITKIINNVFIKSVSNGDYDVEYRTVGVEDKKLRWVRAKGKALFNENDEPIRFIGSVIDITEQKQDEQRKNDFIGMVSHELKTPLTSLTAYIQMLLLKATRNEDAVQTNALGKANQQIKKMTGMINGFLNISRLESGKINLVMQDFSLDELLKDVAEETKLTASGHNIIFIPGYGITIKADRDKISSVATNLVSNAVKYSPQGTNVTVTCGPHDDGVKVTVQDEGLGIRPEDVEQLFDRYYRVENKETQLISGFGIGLYLSSEIIKRHNGKIGVESEPGVGSTFWFTLPLNN